VTIVLSQLPLGSFVLSDIHYDPFDLLSVQRLNYLSAVSSFQTGRCDYQPYESVAESQLPLGSFVLSDIQQESGKGPEAEGVSTTSRQFRPFRLGMPFVRDATSCVSTTSRQFRPFRL